MKGILREAHVIDEVGANLNSLSYFPLSPALSREGRGS
jgi:hypothetical protein